MAAWSINVHVSHQFTVQRAVSDLCVTCVGIATFYMTYLKGTVHHANDVVKLLVVHYGAVLLHVKTQFFSQTLASCLAFQCSQCSRKRLQRERWTKRVFKKEKIPLNKVTDLTREQRIYRLIRGS